MHAILLLSCVVCLIFDAYARPQGYSYEQSTVQLQPPLTVTQHPTNVGPLQQNIQKIDSVEKLPILPTIETARSASLLHESHEEPASTNANAASFDGASNSSPIQSKYTAEATQISLPQLQFTPLGISSTNEQIKPLHHAPQIQQPQIVQPSRLYQTVQFAEPTTTIHKVNIQIHQFHG